MHAVLAFSTLPLFLGALLSDWAYARTYEIQWTNFAAWLITGGLALTCLALVWTALDLLLRPAARRGRAGMTYLVLLLASLVLGSANALVHAKDGWAAMPAGLLLSVLVLLVAAAASVIGLGSLRRSRT